MPLQDWQVKTLQTQIRPVFPPAFIQETLDTLALLLPEHDKNVEAWFEDEQNKVENRGKLPLDPQVSPNFSSIDSSCCNIQQLLEHSPPEII
jgi:hypothetical protein